LCVDLSSVTVPHFVHGVGWKSEERDAVAYLWFGQWTGAKLTFHMPFRPSPSQVVRSWRTTRRRRTACYTAASLPGRAGPYGSTSLPWGERAGTVETPTYSFPFPTSLSRAAPVSRQTLAAAEGPSPPGSHPPRVPRPSRRSFRWRTTASNGESKQRRCAA
jgi:hypothetical protein